MKSRKTASVMIALAMLLSLVPVNAAFAEENYVASIAAVNYTSLEDAIVAAQNDDTINIIADTSYNGSIKKEVKISVKSGAKLIYVFDEGNDTGENYYGKEIFNSHMCNADITVENGGTIEFKSTLTTDVLSQRYLIMNGDFKLESGANARLEQATALDSSVLFQGNFENSGVFDMRDSGTANSKGKIYIKHGETSGSVINGYPIYNFCIKQPSNDTFANREIFVKEIKGDCIYGGVLTAEIDGFGNSADLPETLKSFVKWDGRNYSNANGKSYTIVSDDVGKTVKARCSSLANASPTFNYDYIAVNGDIVMQIHNPSNIWAETDVISGSGVDGGNIYLGGEKADDKNNGTSVDLAVANFMTAVNLADDDGTIVVCGDVTIPATWNFINKRVKFTNKDGDKSYNATFSGGTGQSISVAYIMGDTLQYEGIGFKNNIVFAATSSEKTLTLDGVSTAAGNTVTQYVGWPGFYETFSANIKNSQDLNFDIQNVGDAKDNKVTLDNSSIISAATGNIGEITLKNNSKIKTAQPMQKLTADNTKNKIELLADEQGNVIPINIEGDVTVVENAPISIVFGGTLPVGTKIISSTAENKSLTADKFKAAQIGITFEKQGNDIVTAAQKYKISYVLDGGKLDENALSEHIYGVDTALISPTRSGYDFVGWYLDDTFSTKVGVLTGASYTDDITLYAKWNKRSSGGATRYTVKFNSNGGSTVSAKSVIKNNTVAEPKEPIKNGYSFGGWYIDSDFEKAYDFDSGVVKDITLYAKWIKDDEADKEPIKDDVKNPFTDVKENDWFFNSVAYVNENGLMNGITDTEFEPDWAITRGMLVTVLYRIEGEPSVNRSVPFKDVSADSYYNNAVIWAEQNGIVNGITDTEFEPESDITREQFAVMMFRYAAYKGYDISVGENTNILSYSDFSDISEYAVEAVQYAVGSGLIEGKSDGILAPQDKATRAEAAAILHRFTEGNK